MDYKEVIKKTFCVYEVVDRKKKKFVQGSIKVGFVSLHSSAIDAI